MMVLSHWLDRLRGSPRTIKMSKWAEEVKRMEGRDDVDPGHADT